MLRALQLIKNVGEEVWWKIRVNFRYYMYKFQSTVGDEIESCATNSLITNNFTK